MQSQASALLTIKGIIYIRKKKKKKKKKKGVDEMEGGIAQQLREKNALAEEWI